MEEKKSIKISLKTYLISMFLMLLVIGVLLGYILQTGEKINKEITEKKDNKNIEESVLIEEDKEEIENNNIENIVETEVDNETESKINKEDEPVEEVKKEEFTDDEIKTALENYLNIFHGYGSPEGLLNSLDLLSYEETQNYKLDGENFKITDIPYVEFEKKIKQYTTLENFEKLNKNNKFVDLQFKNVNNYVAYFDGGWSGIEYVVNNITIKGDYSDSRHVAKYYTTNGEFSNDETTLEFDIENDNGNCIISNCYFE